MYFISIYLTLILSYFSVILSGFNYPHYGIILLPCFVVCFAFFLNIIEILLFGINKMIIFFRVFTITLIFIIIFVIVKYPNNIYNYSKSRIYIIKNEDSRTDLTKLANFIIDNTDEKDEILVFGIFPEIYLKSNRMSSSKYSYQNYWTFSSQTRINEQVIKDIDSEKTKALIIADKPAYEKYTAISCRIQIILDYEYDLSLSSDTADIYLRKK